MVGSGDACMWVCGVAMKRMWESDHKGEYGFEGCLGVWDDDGEGRVEGLGC